MQPSITRRCFAEFVGTFCLVFIGTGSVVVDATKPNLIGHLGIALAFGLVVTAMIYAIGGVSGAHINPAVTIAFAAVERASWRDAMCYIPSQITGALVGSLAVMQCCGNAARLGSANFDGESTGTAMLVEFILTAMLMFVVMGVSTGAKQESTTAAIAVGSTVAIEALVFGPITGASMNPARSLGPAIVANDLGQIWVYLIATTTGALMGALIYRCIQTTDATEANAS